MSRSLTLREIDRIVDDVQCSPYEFRVDCVQCVAVGFQAPIVTDSYCREPTHSWFIQAKLWRPDAETGERDWGFGRRYLVEPHDTPDAIVRTCLMAALGFAEHEVRESFLYRGVGVFGPHVSPEELALTYSLAEAIFPRKESVQ